MTAVADLVADLRRPWRQGEHLDARGIVLDDALVLDGLDVRGFDLTGAQLRGGLSARGTRFHGLAWLRGATVFGNCDLSGARFSTDLRCDDLTAQTVAMASCTLQGVLSLAGARLNSLSLHNALVMANMTLERAVVQETVDLTGAEILGGFWTAHARLGSLEMRDAEISGRIRLPG